jgi:HrpA-like RNA helicase
VPQLKLGRGIHGMIGHTQPRRIAARAVGRRAASPRSSASSSAGVVGYQVRFTDQSSRDTRVKVMTDGILLAEMQRDRDLRRYDTIIIDEAHERSLNIDFILGYLKQLLPRRPDLKVIITSATIDPGEVRPALRRRRGPVRRSSRCPDGPIRSRCATGRWCARDCPKTGRGRRIEVIR